MELTGINGKRALVTGAAGGIGAAVVRLLSEAGAHTVATDVAGVTLKPFAANVRVAQLDVRDSAAVEALVERVEREDGPIDIGVNVAGALRTGLAVDTDDDAWRAVFDVNANGVFYVCRALARRMSARRRGNLVTVASNAAGVPRYGMAAYAASKAASAMFMRCLGLELGPLGIRCNTVAPGSTLTPMQTSLWDGPGGEAAVIRGSLDTFKAGIPLGRIANPEDVANAVLFLLSDQARHVTMVDLYVDGGATQRA